MRASGSVTAGEPAARKAWARAAPSRSVAQLRTSSVVPSLVVMRSIAASFQGLVRPPVVVPVQHRDDEARP